MRRAKRNRFLSFGCGVYAIVLYDIHVVEAAMTMRYIAMQSNISPRPNENEKHTETENHLEPICFP